MPLGAALCKIGGIADPVKDSPPEVSSSASVPVIPDHEVLRVIGRGAYGEIWLARGLTGAWRAVKVVFRTTFESERAFQREFQGMSSFEPISRAHPGFVDILHVGRTHHYLYYIMELADDHAAGRTVVPESYVPRTLKTDLDRHRRLAASDSIKLGISLTEGLQALHQHGLTHRDIKPSNIIFIDGVPKLADIGLVAATGQNSFVGTEGYVPPEGPGTAQADVFSLGKVIYEVSTGKDRLDFPEVDSELTSRSDKDEALLLNEVLIRACAGDPRKRYPSAAAMNEDLCRLAAGCRPKRPPVSLKRIAAVAIVILALAAGAFLWKKMPPTAPPPVVPNLEVTIESDPAGASVVLDGHFEKTPATFKELEARRYPIRIMQPGYDPLEALVDLSSGRNIDHRKFQLTRSRGSLEIDSSLAGVDYVAQNEDGSVSRTGTLPAHLLNIPTGRYSLVAKHQDWTITDSIEVKRGETTRKTFAFATAAVVITSDPTGAQISIDGRPSGKTPLQIDLPARSHDLIAHLDGWLDQRQAFDVQVDRKTNPVLCSRMGA